LTVLSYLKDVANKENMLVKRPPHSGRRSHNHPKYIEIPSRKSSSRSNISPFGRTPPTGASNSPTVASCLGLESPFRERSGSVPARPPIFERRRHRTQSEGTPAVEGVSCYWTCFIELQFTICICTSKEIIQIL